MKRIIFVVILHLLINRVNAIDLSRVVGGRAAAMGRTAVCEQGLWALQNNPAGIASLPGWHFGLYYENQWFLKETAFKSVGIVKSFQNIGCIGLSINQFGDNKYSENKFGIAYARGFGPFLQLGLQFDYLLLHWGDGYDHQGTLSFELGLQSQVTERLRLGAYLFNPISSRWKTLHEDRVPIVLRMGLAYQFTGDFIGQCDVERDNSQSGLHLRCGFEYVIFKKFCFRAGAQINPNVFCFGVGYQWKGWHVDVSAQMHQVLGTSIQLGIRN